jgi:AraC-like DNA-binding protein
MFLLRETDRSVTDICFDVGFTSLGTFSRMFREIVGETPSAYRAGNGPIVAPNCNADDVHAAALRGRDIVDDPVSIELEQFRRSAAGGGSLA